MRGLWTLNLDWFGLIWLTICLLYHLMVVQFLPNVIHNGQKLPDSPELSHFWSHSPNRKNLHENWGVFACYTMPSKFERSELFPQQGATTGTISWLGADIGFSVHTPQLLGQTAVGCVRFPKEIGRPQWLRLKRIKRGHRWKLDLPFWPDLSIILCLFAIVERRNPEDSWQSRN